MTRNTSYWALAGTFLVIAAVVLSAISFAHAQTADRLPIVNQLDVGATGNDVLRLQALLAMNSLIYPGGLVTGYYGQLTKNAVVQFQIGYGLEPVGRVGPLTRAKMNSLIASGLAPAVNACPRGNVHVATSQTTATITWTTAESTRGKVNYNTVPITMSEVAAALTEPIISGTPILETSFAQSHSITISGLSPGRAYFYAIESVDQTGNVSVMLSSSFTTQS